MVTVAACFTALLGQEETAEPPRHEADPALVNFLLGNGIIPDENDVLLKVDLFTVVPSVKRMVVRTSESAKTLVLGLSTETFVKDGENFLEFTDLKRGDPLILVVGADHVTVREIYKYRPAPEGTGMGAQTAQPGAAQPPAPDPPAETVAPAPPEETASPEG